MSTSLKEYLKKYETNASEENKKKKKRKTKAVAAGVLVVDEDPVWQKPVDLEEEEENDSPDEKPQVDEDIEVKRMKRLEQLRARRSYNEISEDGSGWVPISEAPKSSTSFDPSSEISPPRNRKARYDTPSPEAELDASESARVVIDLSPPRQRRQRNDYPSDQDRDIYPPRRQRNDTLSDQDLDISPPCRKRNDTPSDQDRDISPPRRQCNDTPSDQDRDISPPRRLRNDTPCDQDSDISPPCRQRNDTLSDQDLDISPPRRKRNDTPSDQDRHISPPRRQRNDTPSDQDSDISPSRRRGQSHGSLSSVPRKDLSVSGLRDSYLDDLSPPRRERPSSPKVRDFRGLEDISPPRKSQKGIDKRGHRENSVRGTSAEVDLSPPRKRKEQQKRGLITGKDVGEEIAKSKKDEWSRFSEMDPSTSGRGAEPVYRIKGKRVSKDEFLKLTKKAEKPKVEEKKLEWGKGLAQKLEAEARLLELEDEKHKPFSRSRDDPELDGMLKDRLRWGDPMAHLVKKKQPELLLSNLGENEKMRESGFIIPQDIPSHSWIKRGLDCEPNRYGIKPGRHWDGVNRSNGYEKQLFKRMNEKRATEREAYLWSVSDM